MTSSVRPTVEVGKQASGRLAGRRREVRQLTLVWAALFLNVLAYGSNATVLPLPQRAGQVIAQGALPLAVILVATLNSWFLVRPNLVLSLMTILALVACMVSIHNEFVFGSMFRALRLLAFVLVLWALTPWWGRRDMVLLRCHRRCLWVALASVGLGAALAPGLAFAFEGRLAGVLWPLWPTQVAHFAAVLLGTSLVLWICRQISTPNAVITLGVTGAVLIATHTRTALLGLVLGLVVAGASLFLGHARARRASALGIVGGLVVVSVFLKELTTWAMRGQSAHEVGKLTGRTEVWSDVVNAPRPWLHALFGNGLGNQSFNGLSIDSSWVATLWEQGWFGVVVHASLLLALIFMAACHERGPQRGVGLFLIIYCAASSVTETGLGVPSPYLLELIVAAAVLSPPATKELR